MPVWLVPMLIKLAIALLEKTGVISSLEASGIRAGTHVIQAVENVKTYSEPSDFPDQVHKGGV